jgi:predicted glycoside hydrolase/deacetylase ChbG (UPF0249 family)
MMGIELDRQRKPFCSLIINADDFGLSDGVTAGIVRAWREGVVTSSSAMINIEGAPGRVAGAHKTYPDLPIGLHLNITTGGPVLPPGQVPTLVDKAGRFYSGGKIIEHLPSIGLDELRAELQAQARLLIASGVSFDHIDYHDHIVALYAPFFDIVEELAMQYRVPVRQPVPESIYGSIKLQGGTNAAGRMLIAFGLRHPLVAMRVMRYMTPAVLKKHATTLKAKGIPAPDWFIDAWSDRPTVEQFVAILRQLPPGICEIVAHPGLVDEPLRAFGGGYVEQRAKELDVLIRPSVRQVIAAQNIRLINFSQLSVPC